MIYEPDKEHIALVPGPSGEESLVIQWPRDALHIYGETYFSPEGVIYVRCPRRRIMVTNLVNSRAYVPVFVLETER